MFLDKVKSGIIMKPHFLAMYGVPGIGKSTFAADAPKPIFLCAEEGANQLDVARLPKPTMWQDVLVMLDELLKVDHDYKTVVIDTVDALEPMIFKYICDEHKIKHIEELGYGKGYAFALKEWHKMLDRCKALREKMNVILLCHSHVKPFNSPDQASSYDRYDLKLNAKASSLVKETVDCLLFANYVVYTKMSKDGKVKGVGDGERVIHTTYKPSWDAKNRFSLPETMTLSWKLFNESCSTVKPVEKTEDDVMASVKSLVGMVQDVALRNTIMGQVESSKGNLARLMKIETKLMQLTNIGGM